MLITPVKKLAVLAANIHTLFYLSYPLLIGLACQPQNSSPERVRARWHNNQGVVYMDQHNYVNGREHFETAMSMDPSYGLAHANFGIAMFSLGKYDTALVALNQALELEPNLVHAHYTRGLIFHAQGKEHEAALTAFQTVVKIDDNDPLVHYYLGRTLAKLKRDNEAINEFNRAINLDPNNVSAHYALAHQLRLLKQTEKWRQTLQRFDELSRAGHEGVSSSYQGQGKHAEAMTDGSYAGDNLVQEKPAVISFERLDKSSRVTGLLAAASVPGSLKPDLVIANDTGIQLWREPSSSLEPSTTWTFDMKSSVEDIAFADFDADDDLDMVVSAVSANFVAGNRGGHFSPGPLLGNRSRRGVPADVDHDGDTDLLMIGGSGNRLWSNDSRGSFTDITEVAGLKGTGGREALFADFDNDRDVDFLILADDGGGALFENNRDGTFSDRSGKWGLDSLSARYVSVDFCVGDLFPDGRMDIATLAHNGAVRIHRNSVHNGAHTFETDEPTQLSLKSPRGLRTADLDNDGDLDLVAFGANSVNFLQGEGAAFTAATPLPDVIDAGWIFLEDFDADGDVDAWVDGQIYNNTTSGGNWVRIDLDGLNSNPNGFGAKVEIKTTSHQQKRELRGGSRSPSTLTFGLAETDSVEFVRILWPSGVRQTELATAAAQRIQLTELNRKGTSCPILYAWDGERYRFVSDFLGGGIIGYLTAPGSYYTPDHDEYVRIESLRAKDGTYILHAANQLEEIIYLDAAQLIAVDHPAEYELHPNERLLSAPPYPEFEACALSRLRPPVTAVDHRGETVLPLLTHVDDNWYDDFEREHIHGYAEEFSLTLDLGDLSGMERPALLAHGWVDYAHSTSNWAAAQAGLALSPPRLEIPDGAGGWRVVIEDLGVPAGLPKHMLVDLSKTLPEGSRRVRISTNTPVYFDQILIGEIAPRDSVVVHRRNFAHANLHWRGYPEHSAIKETFAYRYDYDRLNPYTDWGTHAGSFTRLGDVTELLDTIDDRFVIMFHGDELTMELGANSFPHLTEGWKRTFLFFADGFGKDMDFHSAASLTVEPLPFHDMSRYPYTATESYPTTPLHTEYVLEYNTRRKSGFYE